MKRVLITGGCGFLGHHVAEHIFKNTDWEIVIIDKLTYASSGFKRLRSAGLIGSPGCERVKIYTWDLCSKLTKGFISEIGDIDIILHLAADTHVDNSIAEPVDFIANNIFSTVNLLEYARTLPNLKVFLYFSTDEVYGVAPPGVSYKENDTHNPSNPYSASKSSSEMICLSYANTYKVPVIITNTVNVTGERQHVEKFIPKVIRMVRDNESIDIHANPDCTLPGSRFYIHARNVAHALLFIIDNGSIGEKYNITESKEMDNLAIAKLIAKIMGKELKYNLVNFHESRPGHDLRYDLDGTKLYQLGWKPAIDFERSLEKTVAWTLNNQEWLEYDI
jgi:dTDP-glucose 4,6-dehydratase